MAKLLLDRIRAEIRARLRESEAAAREYERLEAALAALDALKRSGSPRAAADSRPAATRRRAKRAAAGRKAPAPRGANQAAVLAVVGERPGVAVSELSTASGVSKSTLYGVLRTLERRGRIAREQLPGGGTGYRLAAPEPEASTPAPPGS